jgi:hypothetical protein
MCLQNVFSLLTNWLLTQQLQGSKIKAPQINPQSQSAWRSLYIGMYMYMYVPAGLHFSGSGTRFQRGPRRRFRSGSNQSSKSLASCDLSLYDMGVYRLDGKMPTFFLKSRRNFPYIVILTIHKSRFLVHFFSGKVLKITPENFCTNFPRKNVKKSTAVPHLHPPAPPLSIQVL